MTRQPLKTRLRLEAALRRLDVRRERKSIG